MVETRSGRSVSPGESPRGGSPELDEPRKETAGTAGLEARAGPRSPKRSGRGGGGITAGPGGTTQLTHSQAYTLLALALGVISLPLVLTPKLSARFLFGSAADPTEGQHTHVSLRGGQLLQAGTERGSFMAPAGQDATCCPSWCDLLQLPSIVRCLPGTPSPPCPLPPPAGAGPAGLRHAGLHGRRLCPGGVRPQEHAAHLHGCAAGRPARSMTAWARRSFYIEQR